jgi:protein-S-isoprenylcysteine O-methyltransferase Ste14
VFGEQPQADRRSGINFTKEQKKGRIPVMAFLVTEDISALNLILVIAGAALCLLGYLLRLATHVFTYTRGRAVINFRLILVLTFLGYLGWGYWSGNDPVKMNIPYSVSIPVGVILAAAGLGLFLYSEIKKHGVGDPDKLVTTGIYSKIRHPMYVGLVALHIGMPFIFRSFITCLSSILWTAIICVWTHFEEKNLERSFGQKYLDYKKATWF